MLGFLRLRLITAFPVILAVVTFTFFLLHLVPGDPVDLLLGESAAAADRDALRATLGLDRSLLEQYLRFWKDLLSLTWGTSLTREQPVLTLILERFPATLALAAASLFVSTLLALPLAIWASISRSRLLDGLLRGYAVVSMSLPIFVFGPIVVLIFAIQARWFPVAGFDRWSGLVLPALSLGFLSSGFLYRMLRAAILENTSEDYVRTARSKGLSESRIFAVHVLRNAAIPVLTVLGNMLGGMLAGAVVTETLFDWPGIGRLFYSAFQGRDFPLVQGVVLWIALSYLAVNFIIDLLLARVDPRVRLEGEGHA